MSEWFLYDWEVKGKNARFYVDLGCTERFRADPTYNALLYVSCDSRIQDASSFTNREYRRLKSLLAKCKETLGETAIFTGMLDIGARRQFFFYVNDARQLVELYEFCEKEKLLAMSCGKEDEPAQKTYFDFLYPDQAKRQSVKNRIYIEAVEDRGDDISAARRINLYFYFPSDQARYRFGREAMLAGFALGETDFIPERDPSYYITLHTMGTLELTAVNAMTTRAIDIADGYSGVMDHLDAAFVSRFRPKK